MWTVFDDSKDHSVFTCTTEQEAWDYIMRLAVAAHAPTDHLTVHEVEDDEDALIEAFLAEGNDDSDSTS